MTYYVIYPSLCTIVGILGTFYSYDVWPALYEFIWITSILYFILDGTTVVYVGDYLYTFHHGVSLLFLFSRLWWDNDPQFFTFLYIALLMEISNIFYNLRPTLDKKSPWYTVNDACFLLSWVTTRAMYGIPKLWMFAFDGADEAFSPWFYNVAMVCLIFFTGLHAYWGYLIMKKTIKALC